MSSSFYCSTQTAALPKSRSDKRHSLVLKSISDFPKKEKASFSSSRQNHKLSKLMGLNFSSPRDFYYLMPNCLERVLLWGCKAMNGDFLCLVRENWVGKLRGMLAKQPTQCGYFPPSAWRGKWAICNNDGEEEEEGFLWPFSGASRQ